jgi:hypothetical protein
MPADKRGQIPLSAYSSIMLREDPLPVWQPAGELHLSRQHP